LDAASADLSPKVSTIEKDCDGFKTVTYRQKTIAGFLAVITVKHRRQPLIGVRNSAFLPTVARKQRFKALFISRFSHEFTAEDVEKSLICARLKNNLTLMHLFMFR
jgi:hypothetical protein